MAESHDKQSNRSNLIKRKFDQISGKNNPELEEKIPTPKMSDQNGNKQKLKNQYSCFYCFKRFPKRSNARDHIMIHYGLKPFICRLCGKAFRQKGHHKYHVTHVHQKGENMKLNTFDIQQVMLGQKLDGEYTVADFD